MQFTIVFIAFSSLISGLICEDFCQSFVNNDNNIGFGYTNVQNNSTYHHLIFIGNNYWSLEVMGDEVETGRRITISLDMANGKAVNWFPNSDYTFAFMSSSKYTGFHRKSGAIDYMVVDYNEGTEELSRVSADHLTGSLPILANYTPTIGFYWNQSGNYSGSVTAEATPFRREYSLMEVVGEVNGRLESRDRSADLNTQMNGQLSAQSIENWDKPRGDRQLVAIFPFRGRGENNTEDEYYLFLYKHNETLSYCYSAKRILKIECYNNYPVDLHMNCSQYTKQEVTSPGVLDDSDGTVSPGGHGITSTPAPGSSKTALIVIISLIVLVLLVVIIIGVVFYGKSTGSQPAAQSGAKPSTKSVGPVASKEGSGEHVEERVSMRSGEDLSDQK